MEINWNNVETIAKDRSRWRQLAVRCLETNRRN